MANYLQESAAMVIRTLRRIGVYAIASNFADAQIDMFVGFLAQMFQERDKVPDGIGGNSHFQRLIHGLLARN